MCQRCYATALPGSAYCGKHKDIQRTEEKTRHDVDPLRPLYKRHAWLTARKYVLARDPFCTWPGGCNQPSTDIHHVVPAALWIQQHGGDTTSFYMQDNLQALCHAHHSPVTGQAR